MSEPDVYALPQAAFVLGEPIDDVRRTVERKQVECLMISYGGRKVRAVDRKTLVFLSWAHEHHDDIKPALWRKLYDSLKTHEDLPTYVASGGFRASLDDAAKRVKSRLETLRKLERQVEEIQTGETVLKGTTIEVHRIAALLAGGMAPSEVIEDYPSLSADQVAFAQTYAAAHPKHGRPYPKFTAKAALRQTDFSALDLDD
jgi:uncharacterized protein (DUF433 family)